MKRYVISVVVGAVAFALALAVGLLMLEIIFGSYQYFDARHAGAFMRRLLSWAALLGIVGPTLTVLFGLPFVAARRWRTSVVIGAVVAGLLAGVVADRVLHVISSINQSEAGHPFPYDAPPDE